MTPDELREFGQTLYGEKWQTPMAKALKINPRTIRRYLSGATPIRPVIARSIRSLRNHDKLSLHDISIRPG